MSAGLEKITLQNLSKGAASELFERELNEVMKNINDKNTEAKKTRTITLKISIAPNNDRSACETTLQCTSTLAPVKGVDSSILLGKEGNKLTAYKSYEQEDMFDNLTEMPQQ